MKVLPKFGKNKPQSVMYDTLGIWIDGSDIKSPFDVLPYLTERTEYNSEKMGYSCGGRLNNYAVYCNQAGIKLNGSLSEYYLPSNVFTLTRQTATEAFEKMSDELHFDMMKAQIKRVDISTIIPTKRCPADYFSRLGNKPRYKRLQACADTLYYRQRLKQMAFYDKSKEASAKGSIMPPTLIGCNLLRYELRLCRPKKALKAAEPIRAKDLIKTETYYKLIQMWKAEFVTIKKNNNNGFMSDSIKTPKDAKDLFLATFIQQNGQSCIDDFIADLKSQNAFTDPKSYSRLKKDLYKLLQFPAGEKNELISELENAILDIAKYAR